MSDTVCTECGATYSEIGESCETRFALLLSLDHSRQEPWGSRHGQAFAAFALQHPRTHATSLDHAWSALYQIYVTGANPQHVFMTARAGERKRLPSDERIPPRPSRRAFLPTVTIGDLSAFSAETYATLLDAWCRASLASWGLEGAGGPA